MAHDIWNLWPHDGYAFVDCSWINVNINPKLDLIICSLLDPSTCWTFYKTIKCERKFWLLFCYKVTPSLHHPKNNFMSKWHLIQPLQREIYKKCLSPRFSSRAKLFGHASHSTELVCMCLACQQFEFNSADWISNNLHMISSWYLRTINGKWIYLLVQQMLVG